MAQFYTYISFVIPKVAHWDVTDIEGIFKAYEDESLLPAPAWFADVHPGISKNLSFEEYLRKHSGLGISWEMQANGLWVESQEWANVDEVAQIIHLAMKHYQCPGHIGIQACYDCDLPNEGGYGGAAYVITAAGISDMSTAEWIEQHVATLGPMQYRPMKDHTHGDIHE